jgi:hypothetical protein
MKYPPTNSKKTFQGIMRLFYADTTAKQNN